MWRVGSFIERSVLEQVHGRDRRFVPSDEALTEVSNEVVVGGLWPRPRDAAKAVLQLALHLEPGEGGENAPHGPPGDLSVENACVVDARSDGADPDLSLGVRAERERRVQGHAVPDELAPAVADSVISRQRPCDVRALDLETPRARVG